MQINKLYIYLILMNIKKISVIGLGKLGAPLVYFLLASRFYYLWV